MRYSLHFGVTCNAKTPENRVIGCKRVLDQVQTGSGPGPPFFLRAWAEGPAPTHELMYAAPITFGQVMTFPFPPTLKCWSLYRGALVEETPRFFNNVCNTQAPSSATHKGLTSVAPTLASHPILTNQRPVAHAHSITRLLSNT